MCFDTLCGAWVSTLKRVKEAIMACNQDKIYEQHLQYQPSSKSLILPFLMEFPKEMIPFSSIKFVHC